MSGETLVNKLRELHFPGVESLDPQGLDWMFENEALQPMLQWFCQHVNTTNLLDGKQKEEFNSLSQSGDIILKGRQLDEALANLECVSDDLVSEESLKSEIEHLTSSVNEYKKQKQRLMKRRNLLSNHLTALSHRSSKLGAIGGNVKHRYKKVLEETQTDNSKMNDSLQKLNNSVSEMTSLYNKTESQSMSSKSSLPTEVQKSALPSQIRPPATFLSQVAFKDYYSAEESFTTQLTSYTRKQFFQGIAEIASSDEDSRYEILEISDPDSLLVRSESENVIIMDCKELARLQALFVKNEYDRLHALWEAKRVTAHLQCAEGILESLKTGTFSTATGKNKERLTKLQSALVPIKHDFLLMSEKEILKVLQECKDAKAQQVLTGDYNLKLSRQDYFTSNQDKVVNQLIIQRSRNEFLTMALEIELRRHRELHHLLTSVCVQLQKQYKEWQERLAAMGDKSLTPAGHQRETVDSRDKSTARLYEMLDDNENKEGKQLFLTYAGLVENARKLQQKLAGLESSLTALQSTRQDGIHRMEKDLKMCEDRIYTGSSTTSGAPLLTPRPIQDTMIQLGDMTEKLVKGIKDVLEDIENKKKLLRKDVLLARERELFSYFFTNPAKLHQVIDELSARVQAEKHVDSAAQK